MNALHVHPNMLYPHLGSHRHDVDLSGRTLREIAREFKPRDWGTAPLHMAVNGRGFFDRDLDRVVIDPGDHVILSRDVLGIELAAAVGITGIAGLLVGTALNVAAIYAAGLAIQALQGKPKPAKTLTDRDSPTSSLAGISTAQFAGLRIGIPYGNLRVGGQRLSEFATELSTRDEIYGILLALGRGPIAKAAGIDLTTREERNRLGSLYGGQHGIVEIPSGIRINGTTVSMGDANVALRAGTLYQAPVPGHHRGSTLSVVGKLLRSGVPQTFAISANTQRVMPRVFFSQLYRQQSSGQISSYSVQIRIEFLNASNQVIGGPPIWTTTGAFRNGFASTASPADVPSGATQLRLTRITADDGFDTGSESTWSNLVEEFTSAELAYPGLALLALDIRATEQFAGSLNNISVPIWGRLLRWRLSGAWQTPTFFHSGSGKWIGRNPAWIAYDFLTQPYGLGLFGLDENKIDTAALELWAEHNDLLVNDGKGGTHPQFQCDVNIDYPRKAWDWLIDICKTGRAFPYPLGDRMTFKFQRATTTVGFENPPRMLLAESNVRDLRFDMTEQRFRPTIYDAQIQDEDQDFEANPVKVTDPNAQYINEPWRLGYEPPIRQSRDLVGVVRTQQAKRDLLYEHNVNRLRWILASGVSPWDAFGLEPGDLFYLQSDIPRWFGLDTGGYRTTRSGTASTSIYLDHQVVLAPAKTYEVLVNRSDGTTAIVAITSPAGTYAADTALAIASAQSYRKGAVVAFGEQNNTVRIFEVRDLEFREDMTVAWRAQIADDAVFSISTPSSPDSTFSAFGPFTGTTTDAVAAGDLKMTPSADGRGHRVVWSYPSSNRFRARVYLRTKRATNPNLVNGVLLSQYDDARWVRVYDGEASEVHLPDLRPFETYEVAVTVQKKSGAWAAPASAAVEIMPEEFPPLPPGSVQGLRAMRTEAGVELRWVAIDGIRDYEIRRGSTWLGGQLVARTPDPRFLVVDAPVGGQSYLVAARAACGLYSPVIARVSLNVDPPAAFPAADVTVTDLSPSALGTHDGTEVAADGSVQLQRGRASGIYTMPTVDAGRVGPYWWSLNWSWRWRDISGDAASVAVGSGESYWWRLSDAGDGREPTPGKPGVDFDLRSLPDGTGTGFGVGFSDGFGTHPGDLYSRTFTWEDALVTPLSGPWGSVGYHARVVAEVRWDDGSGTWSPWERWRQRVRTARRAQIRFLIDRENAAMYEVFLDPFITACACAKAFAAELSFSGADGPQQRFTVTNPAIKADSRIVGNVVRPDVTEEEDDGVRYVAQVLTRQSGSFDVLVCAEDLDGTEPQPVPSETVEYHYTVG